MSGSRRIDLYQDDRGLSTCFAGANILEEWKNELVTTHKWETLEDFIYYFDEAALEKSLDQVLQATKFRDNRLVRARLKAAHAAGLEAIRTAAAEAKQPDAPDEVLPESTMQQLHKDFASKYGIVLDAFLEPSDALRSRIYREFRKRTMSVISVAKVRSILHQSAPKQQESVRLGAGVQLEFAADEHRVVRTVVEYYFSLPWRTPGHGVACTRWLTSMATSGSFCHWPQLCPMRITPYNLLWSLDRAVLFGWREMTSTPAPRWHPLFAVVIQGLQHWKRHSARLTSIGAPPGSSLPCLRQVCPPSGVWLRVTSRRTRALPKSAA